MNVDTGGSMTPCLGPLPREGLGGVCSESNWGSRPVAMTTTPAEPDPEPEVVPSGDPGNPPQPDITPEQPPTDPGEDPGVDPPPDDPPASWKGS